ncbi:MAG: hypothetical protein ACE5HE_03555 [Phycisphaerae bacterium]
MSFGDLRLVVLAGAGCIITASAASFAGAAPSPAIDARQYYVATSGSVTFRFAEDALKQLGLAFAAQGQLGDGPFPQFAVDPTSTFEVELEDGVFAGVVSGELRTRGALLVQGPIERVVIGNLTLQADRDGRISIKSRLEDEAKGDAVFDVDSVMFDVHQAGKELRIIGELTIARPWTRALGKPQAAGAVIGTVIVEAGMRSAEEIPRPPRAKSKRAARPAPSGRSAVVDGSDVIVAELQTIIHYPSDDPLIEAFAVGTTACNLGNQRANWIASTSDHPVIIQNAYRLKDDRFEQIGLSWVKHGFYAVSQSLCGPCEDETNGSQLGVGCSDPYSATLNGIQTNMSPRSTVNANTGEFPYPWLGPDPESSIDRRLQIHKVDLDPRFNVGARYFVQGHYILKDDAVARTNNNNASYREVLAENPSPGVYNLKINPDWPTQRGQAAVRAWQDIDPTVEETDIQVPGEGLFILAAKASELATGIWRYSYALQNLNSDQSASSFSVPLPDDALVDNIGFHDVDYHSGDPYDRTDWQAEVAGGAITWSVVTCQPPENANALRFGTVYSFNFDSDVQPAATRVTIGLFKPGAHSEVSDRSIGPKLLVLDCNNNSVSDACDLDCGAIDCTPPCGNSQDCNANEVPDECESDCNGNGIPDDCDVDQSDPDGNGEVSQDCQPNGLPDECEFDCDGNNVPDDCEEVPDTDGDGVNNCYDLCLAVPTTVRCACPPRGDCCLPGGTCYSDLGLPPVTPAECTAAGGIPACVPALCRQGCLLGDADTNGVLDLVDIAAFQRCMGSDASVQECTIVFDADDDDDVDLADFVTIFHDYLTRP